MGLYIYRFFVPRAVQAEALLWSDSGVVLLRALDEGWALPLFFLSVTASGCCDGSRRWPGGRSRDRPAVRLKVLGAAMRATARHVICALIAVFCDRAERYAWSVVERSVTVRNAGSVAAEWTTALSALLSMQGVGSGKSKG